MKLSCLKYVCFVFLLLTSLPGFCQKLITYEAGMGTRDANDADTWVLYQRVRAEHDGMIFYADSALLNQVRNDLTAFGHIKIVVSDTTTIFGDQLYYDGESRVLDIWDDTVRLVDGKTVLKSDHLVYDRFASIASYDSWGITTNKDKRLTSNIGYYNSEFKSFDIYDNVVLSDSNMRIETDTLLYSMKTHVADFWSPTHIFMDSTTMYSEKGSYNTDLRYAHSVKASEVHHGEKNITCDTLLYYEETEFGQARGNVVIYDTINDVISTSRYAETNQETRTSFVTDSALVRFIHHPKYDSTDAPDTLYLHADTIFVTNDSTRHLESVNAFRHVKVFRKDAQAMSDSIFYSAIDSVMRMFYSPVIWYQDYQATADTIIVIHDTSGAKQAFFNNGCFFVEKLDPEKFNQVKGRKSIVYFKEGEPDYSDILGNAEMIYHITDEGANGQLYLIGVNVGKGSDMRIYFVDRAPDRVVTIGNPDMDTYPIGQLDKDKRQLQNFHWFDSERPKSPMDVFLW
ncbi:MAG: hypothetical protein MJZ86_05550 [Bacteroidales bacterium]|nr:hypothetical protein [Bacteroidales bacterium]